MGRGKGKASVCCELFPKQLGSFRIQMFTCLPGLNVFLLFHLISTTCKDFPLNFTKQLAVQKSSTCYNMQDMLHDICCMS